MRIHEDDDWIKKFWTLPSGGVVWRKKSVAGSPSTPVQLWQRSFAKARHVKLHERGSGKGAVKSHVRYLLHADSKAHEDRLVGEVGDLSIIKDWEDQERHYRVIIAPERGDVLDMQRMAYNVSRRVMRRFGRFRYAGSIHEKRQVNGRLNKHIHLIFKAPFSAGAAAIKYEFTTAAAMEATLQFEENGLHYIPDPLDKTLKIEATQLSKELMQGDYVQ